MSQETQIGSLSGGISDEDAKLVDSILNDLQQQPQQQQPQQQQPQQQQPSPEQLQMMQQQQMAQRQQQQQQQQMQQQQATQQKMNMILNNNNNDILDNIKVEAKNIMTVVFLCVLLNIDQVDNLFKSISVFTGESGALNMQAVFVKALLIGIVFYLIKTYLL